MAVCNTLELCYGSKRVHTGEDSHDKSIIKVRYAKDFTTNHEN
jgi:hypothetical protein